MAKNRTQKEISEAVEKSVKQINRVLDSVKDMRGLGFFNEVEFKRTGKAKFISRICKSNKVQIKQVNMILNSQFRHEE